MQYEVETAEEYLNILEDDWRKSKLQEIRQIILSSSPIIEESIQYKMLAYGKADKVIFQLNAQSSYVSLYVGNIEKIDPERRMLKGLNMGKGCIRFKKSDKVEDTQIDSFIAKAIKLWQEGKDIDC